MKIFIFFIKIFVINFFLTFNAYTEIISEIIIKGNERISNETVKLFSKIEPGNDINENDINLILKDLYQTNYFENISVSFLNNVLTIIVKEHPIIQSVEYNGVKSNKLIEAILKDKLIKDQGFIHKDVIIEEDCWFGANVVINKGSLVKKGSVVGALSLINSKTEENSINVGIPTKKIGEREK